ncbi:MAG: Trp family transcriptional regulator [bacterium]|nr:Trp family transcriptional regulator [bacterium]
MPHVSKYKAEKKVVDEIQEHFAILLSRIKDKDDIHAVFADLLTQTERTMFAKRLAIVLMLERGYSFRIISKTVKVSESTISAMRDRIDRGGNGFKKILHYFENSKNTRKLDAIMMTIARFFSMPSYAGRTRWRSSDEKAEERYYTSRHGGDTRRNNTL